MLIDDLYENGLGRWFAWSRLRPHIVKLPFPVAPYIDDKGIYARFATTEEQSLSPINAEGCYDGTYAKLPFPIMIFWGPGDTGCLILIQEKNDLDECIILAYSILHDPTERVLSKPHLLLCIPFAFKRLIDGTFCAPCDPGIVETEHYADWVKRANEKLFQMENHRVCHETVMKNILTEKWKPLFSDIIKGQAAHIVTALTLMNAKNIVEEAVDIPQKLRAARIRKGKSPGLDYHVLKIRPLLSRHAQQLSGKSIRDSMSLHFVRGHFKKYSDDKKLFGRHTGLYWWQPHMAGTADRFVDKDYELVLQ